MKKKTKKQNRSTVKAKDGRGSIFCSYPKAAKLLGVGVNTVRNLVKAGTLQSKTYGPGMNPRVVMSSVTALLEKEVR